MRSLALAVLMTSAVARAQAPAEGFSVDPAESTITFHLIHKMHKVDGVSKKIEGKAVVSPDGKAQVVVRAPVESFDSGNVNRDAHMKETLEAARFANVELKALADGMTAPATFPTTMKKTFKAQLMFHGQKGLFDIPIDITWESATRVRAACKFQISLEAYKIERPSLMFVKVDDDLQLDVKLLFKK